MTPETIRRGRAVQACMERFDGKPLRFGTRDCVRLAAHAMHKMGVAVPLLKGVRYRSEAEAARAMKGLGLADLVEAVDALGLEPIPASMTWAADILAMPGRDSGPFRYALHVVTEYGADRTLAFGGDGVCVVGSAFDLNSVAKAWRVP